MKIRNDPVLGVVLEGLTCSEVTNKSEVIRIYETGIGNRQIGRTNMNAVSSRSHLITIFTLIQTEKLSKVKKISKCQLIDLAGSEKLSKTGATGLTMEEGKIINQSLLWLGNVINALTEKNPFVPYRNSKLTQILQDVLGGNSKTTIIIACSPSKFNF